MMLACKVQNRTQSTKGGRHADDGAKGTTGISRRSRPAGASPGMGDPLRKLLKGPVRPPAQTRSLEPVTEERLPDLAEFARLYFVFRPRLSDDELEKLVRMHAGMPEPDKALMAWVRRKMEERFAEAAPMLSNRPAKNRKHD